LRNGTKNASIYHRMLPQSGESSKEFILKVWLAEFQNHQVRVTNSWLRGAKLYIDGAMRAENRSLIAIPGRPTFSTLLAEADGPKVEVLFQAVVTVKAKIIIDGEKVAGDLE
jgi:hypothetical protein